MTRHPRIPPLPPEERDAEINSLLTPSAAAGTKGTNLFATFVRHRELYKVWRPFARHLNADSTLPVRVRELLILRTAWLCQSEYEWGQHVLASRLAGFTDEEIDRVRAGPDAAGWDAQDAVLLRVVDQLRAEARVDDDTWQALADRFDTNQLLELVLLVGFYFMLAFTLNSIEVEPEEGVPTGFRLD
jgi:alkylhydroperoxidase family enzyme